MRIIIHLRNGNKIQLDSVVGADRVMRRWHNPLFRRVVVQTINKHKVCARKLAVLAIECVDD